MENIPNLESFVKRQIHYHERQAYRLRDDPEKAALHEDYVHKFKLFLDVLAQNESLKLENAALKLSALASTPFSAHTIDHTVLTDADLAGLPPELLEQLNIPEQDEQEKLILGIIAENRGIISLDKLLIGLFRKTGNVPQKKYITTKLYRMISKKLIYKVPGKRGVYTTEPMPDSPDEQEEEDNP